MAQIIGFSWAMTHTHFRQPPRYGGYVLAGSRCWDRPANKRGGPSQARASSTSRHYDKATQQGPFRGPGKTALIGTTVAANKDPAARAVSRRGAPISEPARLTVNAVTAQAATRDEWRKPHLIVTYGPNNFGPARAAMNPVVAADPAGAMNKVAALGQACNAEPSVLQGGIQLDAAFDGFLNTPRAYQASGSFGTGQIDQNCNVRGGTQATEMVLVI